LVINNDFLKNYEILILLKPSNLNYFSRKVVKYCIIKIVKLTLSNIY